jgi:hypothetical protein
MGGAEALFAPDYRNPSLVWSESWAEVFKQLRWQEDEYFEISPMEGKDTYWHMHVFMERQNSSAQRILSDALASKSPFSSYMQAIEQTGLQSRWEQYRLPQVLEHTQNGFNFRLEVSLARVLSYHPEFNDHVSL